jgi:glycosyltransferase involved in cell wall biosynthesis
MARVSIMIPTYNRVDLLPYTLDSVQAQTFRDLEIIVVDNASTDGTADFMAGRMEADSRITYIRKPVNEGLIASLITGLERSTGEFFCSLDSDDTIEPDKVKKQVALFDARPDIDVAYTRFWNVDFDGRPINKSWMLPEGYVLPVLLQGDFICFASVMLRRSALLSAGGYDPAVLLAMDWDILLRCAIDGRSFACIQEPLVKYRLHNNNLTRNVTNEETALLRIFEKVFNNPKLPADAAAMKPQAYTAVHLWLAYGFYHNADWENGRRHLSEALRLNPEWQQNPSLMLPRLREMGLYIRVNDPVAFMAGVLDHLPDALKLSVTDRDRLMSAMRFGAALRAYNQGFIAQGRQEMDALVRAHPGFLNDAETFTDVLIDQSTTALDDAPADFVHTVLTNLPPSAGVLRRHERALMASVSVLSAFGNFSAGNRKQVPAQLITAVRHRPSLLRNRGVLSIFARSVLGQEGKAS